MRLHELHLNITSYKPSGKRNITQKITELIKEKAGTLLWMGKQCCLVSCLVAAVDTEAL